MRSLRAVAGLAVAATLLAACGTSARDEGSAREPGATPSPSASPHDHHSASASTAPAVSTALRPGERRTTVRMPAAYTPSAPTGVGTDDYRCFLLDPKVQQDSYITGFDVLPGNPDVVHHVILFRVPADSVAAAQQKDRETPGQGWTCFGDSGIRGGPAGGSGQPGNFLDDAPWLGAWAPGGTEQTYADGFGEELDRGSRIVMQVHYNLLKGKEPDTSAARLRLTPKSQSGMQALQTQLLPAPVEMPCRPEHADGPLCTRAASMADVKKRFGDGPGSTADLLHFLCGEGRAGTVQSCTRPVTTPETVRGVAGHMHLLGRSIKVEVNQGKPDARTLLDIPVWDFDDQGSRPVDDVRLVPGDTLTVTCRHDQSLRDQLPSFKGIPDKYVVWGEGTTDEMCLAILLVTRP
jgi:hypothetical protein